MALWHLRHDKMTQNCVFTIQQTLTTEMRDGVEEILEFREEEEEFVMFLAGCIYSRLLVMSQAQAK